MSDRLLAIEANRHSPGATRLVDMSARWSAGEVVARVDRFAITANNMTYARLGDSAGYWQFFPATDPAWGIIPAWGFLTIEQSDHPEVFVGSRYYGFVPMASHVVLDPHRVRPSGLVDGAAHRAPLPAAYNSYSVVACPPDADDPLRPVLAPVFMLSFLLDHELSDDASTDVRTLITSASAKAAIGTAHLLHARGVVTLAATSERNRSFCAALDCYDDVITYDQLEELDTRPTVVIDIAGNSRNLAVISRALGSGRRRTIIAGLTHDTSNQAQLADLFSAPLAIVRLTRQWGRAEFERRIETAFRSFADAAARWLVVDQVTDPSQALAALRDVSLGTGSPDRATLVTLDVGSRS